MIKVTIKRREKEVKQVWIKGHALYDDYGKDIVCAGVSSIVITSINAMLKYDKQAIAYEEKEGIVLTVKKKDKVIDLLVNNMIDLLEEIQHLYPKNIRIEGEIENE